MKRLLLPFFVAFLFLIDYPRHDGHGRPIMPHPDTGEEQSWTRASTVAKALDDGGGLINWTGAMVAGGAYLRPDLVGEIGVQWPMTDANKSDIYKKVEDLKDAGGGNVGRNNGNVLHDMFQRINLGDTKFKPMRPWADDIAAEHALRARNGIAIDPQYVERTVCLPDLDVAGSFDFIAQRNDEMLIADYKTGKLGSYSWAAWVTQLSLYANAKHLFDWATGLFSPMPPVSKSKALIVHVPAGTGTAALYEVDIEPGMRAVKAALWVREWRKEAKKLAREVRD